MIKLILVIIGTTIGAGFASGKEIEIFFYKYGKNGLLGIILTSAIFGYLIYRIIKIVKENDVDTYEDFLNCICKKKKVSNLIKHTIDIFLLMTFFAMVAGFSNYFNQEWKVPLVIGNIFFVAICYLFLSKKTKGVIKINTVLVPFLIMYIIFLGLQNFKNLGEINIINSYKKNWISSAFLYVSYNTIVLVPIIISLKKLYKEKNEKIIGVIISISFVIMMISLFSILLKEGNGIGENEIPLIYILSKNGLMYKYIYGLLIVVSIFTSAISAGYGFLTNVSKSNKSYNRYLLTISLIAICLYKVSFSYFIEIMYPFFGVLGLLQILLIK